jgi:pyridoxine 5'-phosphate synthase PdxJ
MFEMTHTLHRRGTVEDLQGDYVLLFMQARGVNREGNEAKVGQLWELLSHYEAELANFGNMDDGNSHTTTMEVLKKATAYMGHAVFKDRETLKACLRELKDRDIGVSVVVSGIHEDVDKLSREIGLSPHTVEHSLGTHGNTACLPEEHVLEITTMCGHALVSPNLVVEMAEQIQRGKLTYHEAAVELSRICDCGIFNPGRAEKILRRMTSEG